jgi:hypothetical protein
MANLHEINYSLKSNNIHYTSSTNRILYEYNNSSTFNYHIPVYMQLNFNSISKVDYSALRSEVHCEILFMINVC